MIFKSARFIVTRDCPYNCFYCHKEGIGKSTKFDEEYALDSADFWFLAKTLINDHGLEKLTLTGGDPLLFPNVENLARKITARGVRVKIITRGGSLLRAALEEGKIRGDEFDHICISLDTLDPDRFQEITRSSPNPLRHTLKALSLLKEKGIRTRIHVVVQPNYDRKDIMNILDLAVEQSAESVKMYELIDPQSIKKPYLESVLKDIGVLKEKDKPDKLSVRYHIPYKSTKITPTRCLCNLSLFTGKCHCKGQSLMFDPQGRLNTCLLWDVHKNPYHLELYNPIKNRKVTRLKDLLTQYRQHPCPLLNEEIANKANIFGGIA